MWNHWLSIFCLLFLWINSSYSNESLQHSLISPEKVCYGDLGCFSTGGDFRHRLYRPIDLPPQDPAIINTKFSLYTKHNSREPYLLSARDKEGLKASPLNPEVWTRFIIHGFLDTELFGKWQEALKSELLLHSDINCIIVDWSGGNKPPYAQATSNTRVVGAEIALLIKALLETANMSISKMHIIGHSLGAHVAGYAGERTPNLARISALDAAEPYFQYLPKTVRLDEGDADFVDAIHTDAKTILLLGLGMEQQVGHIDFYPNNGKEQPGCKTSKITSFILSGLVEGGRRFVSCNHQRAIDFFMTTVNYKNCVPVGIGCKDWQTFLEGKCTNCGKNGTNCGVMGVRAYEYYPHKSNAVQPKKYLKTSGKSPYCLFHYVVSMKLNKAKGSSDQEGKVKITLNGQSTDAVVSLNDADQKFYHGSTYQTLFTTPTHLGEIKSVFLQWNHKKKILKPWEIFKKHNIYVEYIQVTPLNVIDKQERDEKTHKYCYGVNKAIDSGQTATFIKDC